MRPSVHSPQRILIVRLSALGDVVHALPVLDALRTAFPRARIDWWIEHRFASLLEPHPQIDHVWRWRRERGRGLGGVLRDAHALLRCAGAIRRVRYDWAIDVQGNLRSGLCTLLSGARWRVGFAHGDTTEPAHAFYDRRVRGPRGRVHRVRKNLALLEALGIPVASARPQLAASDTARQRMRTALGPHAERPFVALHPGVSRFGAFKRWAPERFAALATALHRERGLPSLVTWGPGERAVAERVCALAPRAARLAPATGSLDELMALYERARLVIGVDTGPLQVAAALGTPTLTLFGPKDPHVHGPWDARRNAPAPFVWLGVPCSPCTRRRCAHRSCMRYLELRDVLPRALALLDTPPAVNRPAAAADPRAHR
ncbi:MAG: lipopolysaccharide heptosyltransferase family protein [Planctomycetota bacterium]|nr:MAG: lipopolysaccharide heptosyltransferase family protein [Planctomycetota bacterium]